MLAAACGGALAAPGSDGRLWLVLSEPDGAYADAATALRDELAADTRPNDWMVAPWTQLPDKSAAPPRLVVALGGRAFAAMVDKALTEPAWAKVPLLAALVPRASYEALAAKAPGPTSAVWLDQPIERSLTLLRQAMPERQRVGVLFGPDSESLKPALLKAAAAQGLLVHHATLYAQGDDVYPALRSVLSDSQVLLALPDNLVFNSATLQNILITAYRQRIPMVTYSAAHVKAGATLAVHATPVQIANQAAAIVRSVLAGRGLPSARGAEQFSVAVNAQVGRSLGLVTVDPDALMQAVRRQEGAR